MKSIEPYIIELRSQKVILDSNVAAIYGVETKRVNEAVQRNSDKFPQGYILEFNKDEWQSLRLQSAISLTNGDKSSLKSHLAASKGKVKLLKIFIEKGLYMLATILKSKQATEAPLQIIETFAKVRKFSKVAKMLAIEKSRFQEKNLIQKSSELISDILNQEFTGDTTSETTIKLNLAMIKIKHIIKKNKKL